MSDPTAIEEFERRARQAFENIPSPFADYLGDTVLRIDDWPAQEILDHFGLDSPLQLCGLYQGVPVGEKSPWSIPNGQGDRITLYRRPLLNEMQATGVELDKLIQHVVVHEVGHHFGLSDADMHQIEDSADD